MGATTFGKPVEILLVEDNPGDADLARESLENSKISNTLSVVGDGEEAMAFLRRTGKHAGAPCRLSTCSGSSPYLIYIPANYIDIDMLMF